MSFTPVKVINVSLDFGETSIVVGRLASRERKIYFEYDSTFLARQLDVSPLQLPLQAGAIEYVYAQMASLAGIEVMPTHLFPARHGAGYFATKRFDRVDGNRLHMHTACANRPIDAG